MYKLDKNNLLEELRFMGIKDSRVTNAIEAIKREDFIPKEFLHEAYANHALPIGYGQTVSQPYTVAFMIELLDLRRGDQVLEIGAGSGYNAAIMSKIVGNKGKIYSLEIVKELAENAKKNLQNAKIGNAQVINTDGYSGWKKGAPYDRIIITAACRKMPEPLVDQLKNNGVIVVPIERGFAQVMTRIEKHSNELSFSQHGYFRFVPFKMVNR